MRCHRRASEIHDGGNGARRCAVVLRGEKHFPNIGVIHGAAHADFAQANMLAGAGNGDESKIGRRVNIRRAQASGVIARDASRADEYDFSGTLGLHPLSSLGEIKRALKIQGRGPRLGLIDGPLNLLAVGLKQERGSRQDAGAYHHHAICQRERIHIAAGREARLIDQAIGPEPGGHPGRNVQNQNVVARVADRRTQPKLRYGQQQQQQADQLQ